MHAVHATWALPKGVCYLELLLTMISGFSLCEFMGSIIMLNREARVRVASNRARPETQSIDRDL